MSDQRSTLHELGSFVQQRISEDVRTAEAVGDERALDYARRRLALHAEFQADIDGRPWARGEVGNYLHREALLYRDHPDFREWWN